MTIRSEIERIRRDLPPVPDGRCPGGSRFKWFEEFADAPAAIEPDPCELCQTRHWAHGEGIAYAIVTVVDRDGRQLNKAEVEALRHSRLSKFSPTLLASF